MTLIMNVSLVMMAFSFCLPFGGVSPKAAPATWYVVAHGRHRRISSRE